jgi:diguanylate cyclase (GGDEF)-like protein
MGSFNEKTTMVDDKSIVYSKGRHPYLVIYIGNDNGRQNGDLILAQFANTINENKRTEDLFGRYSSDEFIILPRGEMSKESIQVYCEHLRKAAQSFEFCFEQTCVRITISLGFHLAKTQRSNADTMLLLWNMKG